MVKFINIIIITFCILVNKSYSEIQNSLINDSTKVNILKNGNVDSSSLPMTYLSPKNDSIDSIYLLQIKLQESLKQINSKIDTLLVWSEKNHKYNNKIVDIFANEKNSFDLNLLFGIFACIIALFSLFAVIKIFTLSVKLSQGKLKPLIQFIPKKIQKVSDKKIRFNLSLYNYSPNRAKNIVIDFDFGKGWIVEYLRANPNHHNDDTEFETSTFSLTDYPIKIDSIPAGVIRDDIEFQGDFDWEKLESGKSIILKVRIIWEGFSYRLFWNIFWKKSKDLIRYEKVQDYQLYYVKGVKKAYSLIPVKNAIHAE